LKTKLFVAAVLAMAIGASLPALGETTQSLSISDRLEDLPPPVREMRQKLIEAATTGEVANLVTLMEAQKEPPQISFGDPPRDTVAFFKENSLDGEGRDALAALVEILKAPYALETYGEDQVYVWPYLAGIDDLGALTPAQLVDAYQLTSPQGLKEMIEFGGWFDYRVVIAPDGTWSAFIRGD